MRPTRRWYYSVRTWEGSGSTFRKLEAATLSELVDKAIRLYRKTWKKWPDLIEIERQNDYTFK